MWRAPDMQECFLREGQRSLAVMCTAFLCGTYGPMTGGFRGRVPLRAAAKSRLDASRATHLPVYVKTKMRRYDHLQPRSPKLERRSRHLRIAANRYVTIACCKWRHGGAGAWLILQSVNREREVDNEAERIPAITQGTAELVSYYVAR
jgi:hypothetical protein